MRFAFTEEQRMIRDAVRDMLARECPPDVLRAAWEDDAGRLPSAWGPLADMGILGALVAEAHGGLGMAPVDLVLVLEEAGWAGLPGPLSQTAFVAAPLIAATGGAPLRAEWLPLVAAGDAVVAVGLDEYPYVVDAHLADLLLLGRGDDLYALTPEQVALTEQRSVDGSRRLFRVAFDCDAQAPVSFGEDTRAALVEAGSHGALAAAAELIGVARRMLDLAVEYAKVREQFGKAIASFQAVKHHLANALLKVELAAPLVYRAAYSLSHDSAERAVHVSMAKAAAGEAATSVGKLALQVHGAIGYTYEYDLHMWLKRAWVLASAWGDAATHRANVAVALVDG